MKLIDILIRLIYSMKTYARRRLLNDICPKWIRFEGSNNNVERIKFLTHRLYVRLLVDPLKSNWNPNETKKLILNKADNETRRKN